MDEWNKLNTIIISIISSIGIVGGILIDFIIAGPIIGVVAGFVLSYIVQSKTQQRAWKREFTLKSIEGIYGPLYDENMIIESCCKDIEKTQHYESIKTKTWFEIKVHHKYYIINDTKLSKEIDKFYNMIENYNKIRKYVYDKIMEIIQSEGSQFYKKDVRHIKYYFLIEDGGRDHPDTIDCLINNFHPKYAKKENMTDPWEIQVDIWEDGSQRGMRMKSEQDYQDFDKLWQTMKNKVKEDGKVIEMKRLLKDIDIQNTDIREKLIKKIQTPWKI